MADGKLYTIRYIRRSPQADGKTGKPRISRNAPIRVNLKGNVGRITKLKFGKKDTMDAAVAVNRAAVAFSVGAAKRCYTQLF